MTRLILLGLVTIAMVIIAPLIGASRSVSVAPDRPSSWLSGRPIIPELPEETGSGGDERRDNDEEWRDRRRDRNEEWRDRQRDREEWWDDEDRQRDREEARDFFEDIFN